MHLALTWDDVQGYVGDFGMNVYNTTFKHVGAAYDETLVLLEEYYKRGSWSEVVRASYEENILKKRSSKWIEMLLRNVKRRYFKDHPPLPRVELLSRFVHVVNSNQIRIQAFYQYICEAHPLVDRLVVGLVGNNLLRYGSFRLTKNVFREFLSKEAEIHPELKNWAEYTKEKWRRDFYAFLRSSGLMEKHPSVLVKKFVIKPETFAFFIYGLIDEGFSPSEIFRSRLWKRYYLTEGEIEEKLSECQVRGWLNFRSMGRIFELNPKFNSLEEWLGFLEYRKI